MQRGRDAQTSPAGPEAGDSTTERLWRAGRTGWAVVGVAAAIGVIGLVASQLKLVVVPVVLALFPATVLDPVCGWLKRHGLPNALAALLTMLGGLGLLALIVGLMVPVVIAELPQLVETADAGLRELQRLLAEGPLAIEVGGLTELLQRAGGQLGDIGGIAGPALSAATAAIEIVTGSLLTIVLLFFFLKDGTRLSEALLSAAPQRQRTRIRVIGEHAWEVLGAFFRGQLLIALVDAVAIGLGLALLRVPLVLPLTLLIFFGGLFPIVGALTTGILAVLVALAHGGLALAAIVTALVVAVQQLEGNVLEPFILGRAVQLHPVIVVCVVTAGAITFGVLGAFLAVPLAAITARTITLLHDETHQGTAVLD